MIESDGLPALWARFETWLRSQDPSIVDNLAAPVDDAILVEAEAQIGRALPQEIKDLLRIHNGGRDVIGGWELLSAQRIATLHRSVREHFDSPGWIPFVSTGGGDYLCIDTAPGPDGMIFMWHRDGDPGRPLAPTLSAWLHRIVTCVEAGEIFFDADREEFLPFYGSTGFMLAFQDQPPLRFDAVRTEAPIRGLRSVTLFSVDSAGPLPKGCRVELATAGTVVHTWDVDVLRETEEIATDYNVLVEDPQLWVPIGADATVGVRGLTPGDIVWVLFATRDARAA